MDPTNAAGRRFSPPLTDVVTTESAPRPTAVPPRVHFASVLASTARGLVRGAEQAMTALPGGPLVALAIRGGAGAGSGATATLGATPGGSSGAGLGTRVASASASAEGPQPTSGAATGTAGDGTLQSTLQQSQDMNLYFLQIQEEVNAQNRAFSALSNVLKAEHDTVKTAIGNIR